MWQKECSSPVRKILWQKMSIFAVFLMPVREIDDTSY